jgi:hypothetical protein
MRRRGKVWKNRENEIHNERKKRDRGRDKGDIMRQRRLEREKTKPVDR